MFEVRIDLSFRIETLIDDYQRQVRDAFDTALLDVAAELEANSPEGASGELKAGWDVIATKRRGNSLEVQATILNRAPEAQFRIAGRGPGKFPPALPIEDWVEEKLGISDIKQKRSVAFLIRRKIAKQGTSQWKAKRNFAGLNQDGSFQAGGLLDKAQKQIQQRLSAIRIDRKRGK